MKLNELREIIDQIDEKVVQLLNERCKIAGKVGVWKIENDHPIFVPEREKLLFDKLKKQNQGPLSNESLTSIYREIISGAIAIEQPLKIGYCLNKISPPLKHPARLTFGESAEYVLMDSVHDLFSALENNDINYGVVPFYDGNDCFDNDTIDSLLKTNMNIVAESISKTTGASSLIIGAQSPINTGDDRTALRLEIDKVESNLKSVIKILEESGIDIICCELRISQEGTDSNLVFIEVAGHPAEDNIKTAISQIERETLKIKLLGGYPLLLS
jgi:chorismate mutase-like protein